MNCFIRSVTEELHPFEVAPLPQLFGFLTICPSPSIAALAPYDFMRLPFIAVPAYLFFAEVPDLWTWIGAAVIFGSSVLVTRAEARHAR